ncbi:hypothetical protein D9M73_211600 [compost metagenome]
MERAGERRLVALADAGQGGAAMLASVDQGVELTIAVAGNDHRLAAGAHRDEVVVIGQLAFVAGVDPVLLEDQFHLQIEQLRLGEHLPGDAENTFCGTEVQAAFDKRFPLLDVSFATHGVHLFLFG